MKVLVTGGTGFLGRRTVERLAKEHSIRLLVRASSSRERFPPNVEFAVGDVTDLPSLHHAVEGCEAVVHAAALVKILAPREEFDRINIGGLENVLTAAKAAAVKRMVYVSSFIALGPTERGRGGVLDESAGEPVDPNRPWINDYERTKALSDRRARAAIEQGVPLRVVYPGVIYGPGELTEGNIVVRHVMDLVAKKLPGLLGKPERVWNYVFVEDVAEGIARTLSQSADGARYVLGGENVRQDEFYRLIGELTGARIPTLRFPDAIAKASGALMKAWALWTNGVPQLTPDLVEIYRHDWAYDSARAGRELGYQPRSLRAGLTETVAWLKTLPESGLKA